MNRITKEHLEGNLKGLKTTEITYHGFELNKVYSSCVTGSKYKITKVEKIIV